MGKRKSVRLFTVKIVGDVDEYYPTTVAHIEDMLRRAGLEGYVHLIDRYITEPHTTWASTKDGDDNE